MRQALARWILVELRATSRTQVHEQVILETNDETRPIQVIPVDAEVLPLFLGPATLELSGLAPGEVVRTAVTLRPIEPGHSLHVAEVRSDQSCVTVTELRAVPDGYRFQVTVTAPPAIGLYKGRLRVRLTRPVATAVEIPVSAWVVAR